VDDMDDVMFSLYDGYVSNTTRTSSGKKHPAHGIIQRASAIMRQSLEESSGTKLGLTACHDSTLTSMLHVLQYDKQKMYDVPYVSHIQVLLWKQQRIDAVKPSHVVTILFNNKNVPIPGCSDQHQLCSLESFEKLFGKAKDYPHHHVDGVVDEVVAREVESVEAKARAKKAQWKKARKGKKGNGLRG